MPQCGSQCWLCDLPVHFDTYSGCTHDCKYCFVRRKSGLQVQTGESVESLVKFINGKRPYGLEWLDWNIPIHWGGVSDPFQPCEAKYKKSLSALKVFADTGYPVIISTKGKLCIEEPYLSLIEKANCVMQISALCSRYDALEKGAPTFEERVEIMRILTSKCKRVIVRCQPYIHDVFLDVLKNIPVFAEAGVYGIIVEGMKFAKKKNGLVKRGGDWCQPKKILKGDFAKLRKECHKYGIKFYSGENCLREMGDSLTCCGIDGLEGFVPNKYNLNHILRGDIQQPSKAQMGKDSARCFRVIFQEVGWSEFLKDKTFSYMMKWLYENKTNYVKSVMFGEK